MIVCFDRSTRMPSNKPFVIAYITNESVEALRHEAQLLTELAALLFAQAQAITRA
jgi:hypothetical protein